MTALTNGITIAEFQPQNNKQAYLAYLCGKEIDLPTPRTTEEVLLYQLCLNGTGGDETSVEIKDCAYLFADDGGGYVQEMRVPEIEALMPLVKKPTRATRMFYGWASADCPEEVDLSKVDWSECTDFKGMFGGNKTIKRVDFSSVDMSGCSSSSAAEDIFDSGCSAVEEVIGIYSKLPSDIKMRVTFRGSESSPKPLKRFTFASDMELPISCYAEPFNFVYCSFDREGMVEMFNSLPINEAGGNYAVIKITGNPCVTDGTLTDEDRAIATNKGWSLTEA